MLTTVGLLHRRGIAATGSVGSDKPLESMADVVDIVMHRFKTMSGTQGRLSLGAATIEVPVEDGLTIENGMSEQAMNDVLTFAADPNHLSPRSAVVTTYALCGFANFASVGIQIGGISTMAPERRHDLSKIGLLAMFGGTLASLMTAAVVGVLI